MAVKASNFDAEMHLSLPLLAAETQIGRAQTESTLLVNGYVGAELASLLPKPGVFDVEKYAELMDAMGRIQELVNRDVANVRPVPLQIAPELGPEPDRYDEALGTAWALSQMAEGRSLDEAKREFPLTARVGAEAAIDRTYEEGSRGRGGTLASDPMAWAESRLDGLRFRRSKWWLW